MIGCDYVGEDAELVQVPHLVVIALRNPHLVRCFGCYASEAVSDDFILRRAVENQKIDAPSGTLTGHVNPGIVTVLALMTSACQTEFDLVLEGGTVIDGTGVPGMSADVGVLDGKIAEVGDLAGRSARGRIETEMVADQVVFDPETVIDRATFDYPHQYPVGIPHVFVAGQAVVCAGKVTGERPGAILRGPGYRNH